MPVREVIARIDSTSGDEGLGTIIVYRLGAGFTIVDTVEKNGDAEVVLSKEQAHALASAMIAAVDATRDES